MVKIRSGHTKNDISDKLVAFLDILGFKQLVLQDESKTLQTINFMDGHIRHILHILKEQYGKTFSTKLFSDCICLSCEYSKENVFYIMYELAYIQFFFSLAGIFLRGALTSGNHFENNRIIFSQGLIKAYEMEHIAKYPRIIIDKELIDHITSDGNPYFPIYVGFKKYDFLIQSPDGQFFIDYLNILHDEGHEQIDSLNIHKRMILKKVQENHDDSNVIDKFHWLAEYHNFKFNEMFTPDDWEEPYYTEVLKDTSIDFHLVFPQFSKIVFED